MTVSRRLIIIVGQEGAGKSTIVRALVPETPHGAKVDAEDVGQVNPWSWNDSFKTLLWNNVTALAQNFWQAGYTNVIAGSFINDYSDYAHFRTRLDRDVEIYLIHLCASKAARDRRRIERSKPSNKQWRDELDQTFPEDTTLRDAEAVMGAAVQVAVLPGVMRDRVMVWLVGGACWQMARSRMPVVEVMAELRPAMPPCVSLVGRDQISCAVCERDGVWPEALRASVMACGSVRTLSSVPGTGSLDVCGWGRSGLRVPIWN